MLNNPSFQQGMVSRGVSPSYSALTESQGEVISPMRSQLQRTGMTDIFADPSFRQGLQDTAQNRMNQRVSADVGQDIISRAFQANEAARRRKFGREQNQLNRDYRGSESALDQAFRGDQAQLGREYRGGEAALDRDYRESELIKGIDFRGSESDLQRQYGLGQEDRRISDVQGRKERQQEMEDYARQSDLFRSGAIDELGEGASSAIFGKAGVRTGIEQDLIQRAREMGVSPQELQDARSGITDQFSESVDFDPSQYTMSPQRMMEREEQLALMSAGLPYDDPYVSKEMSGTQQDWLDYFEDQKRRRATNLQKRQDSRDSVWGGGSPAIGRAMRGFNSL